MKAIRIDGDTLVWGEAEPPALGPGEVRIAVQATAINRADLVQRSGNYPPPPGASDILGLECAGEIVEVGEGVTRVEPGDLVCALLAGGGYAEQVVVPAGQVLKVPAGFDAVRAAAIPEVFATAYLNLYMEAALAKGERVLLHAGASGVGTAGVQLCRAFGNPCLVTAGGQDKIERCVALGADGGADRHAGGFEDTVKAWTDGAGVDVILDPVGAGYLEQNVRCLATGGRLVLIGLMGGAVAEIHLGMLLVKRLRLIGSTLRARPISEKAAVMDALQRRVWPLFESGDVEPVIERVMPITEADAAHALVASNETVGKVVLTVG
ncbi:MAG: NAD(P)H-quinone oxidoreductase [Gammaproteobacteria bacterium]|nr:NAD(P)H-quinone oxidoreductase [Gammaproteobacteria bacterium]|tara:strand:+ start:6178 stop:7146 length:969 start_codon:yes stop_codon:yes gene_type:complete